MLSDGTVFVAPSYPLETVVDPTGAGDSFAGGVLGYLSIQDNLTEDVFRQSIAYGTVIASHTVEGFGTQKLATTGKDAIKNRFFELRDLTRF
jgi:sugar/nucleoside kinase (ribokinase family)